jgi:glucose/arabinose dehydrogenase
MSQFLSGHFEGDHRLGRYSRLTAWTIGLVTFVVLASGMPGAQQAPAGGTAQPAPGARGRGAPPAPVNTLGAGPWDLGAGRGRVHVTLYARDLDHPWGIAFLPGGGMLVTERPGRLRAIRNGVLDPTPIGPLPAMLARSLGGLLDVSLHPRFVENHLIYLAYSKPGPAGDNDATTAVYRARWDGGSTLADGKDIFVANAYHGGPGTDQSMGPATGSYGSRIAWDRNGLMYVTLGDRNIGKMAQEPGSHIGKIVRLKDDGSVPPDNPFVGKAGWLPEIYTLGHRNPLGLAFDSQGQLWSTEEGPQGGDELNLIQAGKNYGWPRVSLGRNYDGTRVGEGFTAPGLEEPVVFWVPAIAISGLSFYDGDKFPQWKGNAFVGGMRANTGQHIQRVQFNAKGLPTGREIFLAELKQRIREVKPGPDGYLYALTDETFGAILRVEPPVTP